MNDEHEDPARLFLIPFIVQHSSFIVNLWSEVDC